MQPSTQVLLQSLYERYAMRIFTCFLCLLSPLLSRSVEDCSLPVAGTTVSTVGTDPLFRRLRGVLSDASGPKDSFRSKQVFSKWAEQRAEYSDGANFAR